MKGRERAAYRQESAGDGAAEDSRAPGDFDFDLDVDVDDYAVLDGSYLARGGVLA